MRALARVLKGERKLDHAARLALQALLSYAGDKLSGSLDPAVLDSRDPAWRAAVEGQLLPAIEDVFTTAFEATAREVIDPAPYAVRHLESVWNRLVGEADTVFDMIRTELESGRQAGESIAQLSRRIDAYLSDERNWKGRATTIARTETIGANNAGARDSARATAALLGVDPNAVVRTWLATDDGRTRPSHQDADGQAVLGLSTPYTMSSGAQLIGPGDPGGPADEVVNCRCTELFSYPGDPDYPTVLASAGRYAEEAPVTTTPPEVEPEEEQHVSVIVCALPAANDPVQSIGPERKHATLLYFGDVPGSEEPNEGLTSDFAALLAQVVQTVAEATAPFAMDVGGVEPLGDDGAQVWMLTGDELPTVRDQLLDTDTEVVGVLNAVEQYPTYTPHVTVGYTEDGDPAAGDSDGQPVTAEELEAAAAVESITFDRLAIWWAGEQTEYPLTGTAPDEEEPMDEQPEEATAVRAVALRIRGLTFAAIAEELAYESPQAARAAIEQQIVNMGGRVGTYAEEEPGTEPTQPEPPADPDLGPEVEDMAADGDPWYGILCPEGVLSGDARQFGDGAISWRDLPLPLMYQDAQALGHDGAVRVGRIDNIWRDSERYARSMIRGDGVWDTSPIAVEAQRQVEVRMLRGVSVDCDQVTVELVGSNGEVLDPMVDEFPEDGVVIEQALAARISGATLCSIPAFHQAYVANGVYDPEAEEPGQNEEEPEPTEEPNGAPLPDAEVVAASGWRLVASAAPIVRPAAAFANPGLDSEEWTQRYPLGVPLTLEPEGDAYRVYGHLATWGVCHIGIDGICQEPPESFSDYGYYAAGLLPLDNGESVRVGPITMGTGHAPLTMGWRAAMEHYDNTGTVVADVTIGQDTRGIWFAGMTRPGVTPEQVYALQAAGKISGDWREVVRGSDELELVAALVVNVPGFPIPRPAVAASAGRATAMVASGIVRSETAPRKVGSAVVNIDGPALQQLVAASVSRHMRVLAARDKMDQLAAARRERKVAALAARMERN